MKIKLISEDEIYKDACNFEDNATRSLEDISKMVRELHSYIISNRKIEPLVFLYGIEKGISKIKELGISTNDSQSELLKILESYREDINGYILGEFDYQEFKDEDDNGPFYKIMDKEDLDKTNKILSTRTEADNIIDFLKPKFKNVFFIIEINLNESGSKKIILLKSKSKNFN